MQFPLRICDMVMYQMRGWIKYSRFEFQVRATYLSFAVANLLVLVTMAPHVALTIGVYSRCDPSQIGLV